MKSIQEHQIFENFEPAVDSLTVIPEFAKDIMDALNSTHEQQKVAIRKQMDGFKCELRLLEVAVFKYFGP